VQRGGDERILCAHGGKSDGVAVGGVHWGVAGAAGMKN
jgi:hypothetical protein